MDVQVGVTEVEGLRFVRGLFLLHNWWKWFIHIYIHIYIHLVEECVSCYSIFCSSTVEFTMNSSNF